MINNYPFIIIPYRGHYELYIESKFEGSYDSQDEALKALNDKGYKFYT